MSEIRNEDPTSRTFAVMGHTADRYGTGSEGVGSHYTIPHTTTVTKILT